MYSFKSLFIAALLSTVVASPLKDRVIDNVDGTTSLETRGEPVVSSTQCDKGDKIEKSDCGCGDKVRLESEIHNREQLKQRLDDEIHRREDIKQRLDEEIRQKQQNGGGGCGGGW